MRIILGSSSPRRRELMGHFNLEYDVASPPFNESSVPFAGDPEAYVQDIAQGKAASLVHDYPTDLLITADTIVYKEGQVFPKPRDEYDAFTTLCKLVASWHTVYTGVVARLGDQVHAAVSATRVEFNNLTPDQIRHYHRTLHCYDKAGAYAIQGAGGMIVKQIEGCYHNVVGMPLDALRTVLLPFGIELWDYIASL